MSTEYKRYQEGVIRSILARPEEIVEVIEFIDTNDFDDVNLKLTYESILELYLEKKTISLPEIALKIGESGGAINTGWLFNLENNISDWIQVASPKTWAKLLKRESTKYKAIETLKEGISEMTAEGVNPLDQMDNISSRLTEISVDADAGEAKDISEVVDNFIEESEKILETGGKIAAINSAYPSIDYYTQGWAPTHLITVGARTGIGKSVFAINNAVSAMSQGKSVLFFSLEMTEREVISRMVASIALIPIQKIEKAEPLTEDEIVRRDEALKFIAESKLIIDTNPHVTVEYIKRASIKAAQGKNGLDFVIIDYLQLIGGSGKARSRQEEVADVSRNMKILGKELNVPVMVLVQLLRERRDEDTDQVPKLYEIRESGAIAQDSNVVILIHRDKDKDAEIIDPKALFIIAKNRQGEDNKFISVRTRLESSLFIDDGQKGQEVIQGLEYSSNDEDEQNYESTAYMNPPDDFNMGEDDGFSELFGDGEENGPFEDNDGNIEDMFM